MLNKYLSQVEFSSYEDLMKNFHVNIPENFNFAYDVVDEYAKTQPDKVAIVWCDESGAEATFTFGQLKEYSDKTANFFRSAGIKRGDPVMLVLKRRYEFWFCILALHKLGAITIPATHLLTAKDYVYRANAADIKMIVCVPDPEVIKHVEDAQSKCPSLVSKALVCESKDGWIDFTKCVDEASNVFERPQGELASKNSIILGYL